MNSVLNFIHGHKKLIYFTLGVYWIVLVILTSLPTTSLPKVGMSDKAQHFLAYFFLAVLLDFSLRIQKKFGLKQNGHSYFSLLIVTLYGIFDEVHQYFIPGRFCEFSDFIADLIGGICGVLFVYFLLRKNKSQESAS
ncbi:MAG: hypothetical protein FJ213_02545 [Ignavibacteria bacterium]|nr:hypothetical protein [Ignavibacteria bacterium]